MGGTSDLDFGHIEGTIGEYVQPWEVFRGWTPGVPTDKTPLSLMKHKS